MYQFLFIEIGVLLKIENTGNVEKYFENYRIPDSHRHEVKSVKD